MVSEFWNTEGVARTQPSKEGGHRAQPLEALAQQIREHMPITEYLGFSLFTDADGDLTATAPLAPNANHRESAFGGSLSMLATVTGWAMTTLLLREAGRSEAQVVIQKGSVDYREPVCSDLALCCTRPAQEAQADFFESLRRWGRARLSLQCLQERAGKTCVVFEGAYVALTE